jgi:hypothetical protein
MFDSPYRRAIALGSVRLRLAAGPIFEPAEIECKPRTGPLYSLEIALSFLHFVWGCTTAEIMSTIITGPSDPHSETPPDREQLSYHITVKT